MEASVLRGCTRTACFAVMLTASGAAAVVEKTGLKASDIQAQELNSGRRLLRLLRMYLPCSLRTVCTPSCSL